MRVLMAMLYLYYICSDMVVYFELAKWDSNDIPKYLSHVEVLYQFKLTILTSVSPACCSISKSEFVLLQLASL